MLVKCPECKGRVSEIAKYCPHCGYQLKPAAFDFIKGFFSTRRNVIGVILCSVGVLLPIILLTIADGDDEIILATITTVHLLPVGLVVMIERWKRWLVIVFLLMSLGSCALGVYGGVLNLMKDDSHVDWLVWMFVWSAIALVDVVFLGVRLKMTRGSVVRQSFSCLGRTIVTLLGIVILACGCDEIHKFLFSLFTPGSYLEKSVYVGSLMMRQIRTMGCFMILFPLVFCLPIVKMTRWAWGNVASIVCRALSLLVIGLMMVNHLVKCAGRLNEFASGNDWTILVFMALSALLFFGFTRKKSVKEDGV